jgi:hypothetical protein
MKLISRLTDRAGHGLRQRIKVQSPAILFGITSISIASLFLAGIGIGKPDPAFALGDKCKDVKITIKNGTTDTLKVKKFLYQDVRKNNKEHLEALLGGNGRDILNPGNSVTDTRDLAFVGNDLIRFKVIYEHKIGRAKFEDEIIQTTGTFTCKNNSSHTVSLTK